jgi:hypothetical protein
MRNDEHARARHLIDCEAVEGLEHEDREWLDRHLKSCASCGAAARATERAIGSVRLTSVTLPLDLAARTQYRVGLRAQEALPRRQTWALWFSVVLSWILGVASAPLVWRGFEWAGRYAGVPPLWLKLVFGLWWALPAGLAAAIWAIENRKIEER